jgi:hypothetical protein
MSVGMAVSLERFSVISDAISKLPKISFSIRFLELQAGYPERLVKLRRDIKKLIDASDDAVPYEKVLDIMEELKL